MGGQLLSSASREGGAARFVEGVEPSARRAAKAVQAALHRIGDVGYARVERAV